MNARAEFLKILVGDGTVRSDQAVLTPLAGGVSSDIYRVDDGDDVFVVKRALPKLRVADVWLADRSRNQFEQRYLRYVGQRLPGCVPAIGVAHREHGYFTMEYLGDQLENWKQLLLAGSCQPAYARRAGEILGTIHGVSADDKTAIEWFQSTKNFHQLRTAPYLLTTGARHPGLQASFIEEANRLESTRECLVHGDYSPKNILLDDDRFMVLDCEVAWYGDPAFDVGFMLNHLLLKSLFHAPSELPLDELVQSFWHSYQVARDNPAATDRVWQRLERLLPMLLLARIDGKSPAEYLTDRVKQDFVRQFVERCLTGRPIETADILDRWFLQLPAERS